MISKKLQAEIDFSNRDWTRAARELVKEGYTPKKHPHRQCTFHKGDETVALVRTWGEPWRRVTL